MMTDHEVQVLDPEPARPMPAAPANVLQLMALALEKGESAVTALERLIALHERMQAAQAQREFRKALTAFQRECPEVPRTSVARITTKSGGAFEYAYADLEQIMEVCRPRLSNGDFSVTFDTSADGGHVTVVGRLLHVGGHHETSSCTIPTDSSSAMSEQQKVAAAITFAKRQVLMSLLGLTMTDPDVRAGESGPISSEQAATLHAMLEETKSNLPAFLGFMRVKSVEEIPASEYRRAINALEAKRRGQAPTRGKP